MQIFGWITNLIMKFQAMGGDNSLTSRLGFSVMSFLGANESPTQAGDSASAMSGLTEYVLTSIQSFITKLIYAICKFALNIIDFCEIIVNKLAGIGTQYDLRSFDAPIFRFLLHDAVLTTFGILLGVSILLVIVFAIIAIVKSEYESHFGDQANQRGAIIRRSLKSFFLFAIVPMVLVAFIIFTNALLNSVNGILKGNGNQNTSLGGEIFIASAYDANKYRIYAETGTRTPILFDFDDPTQNATESLYTAEELHEIFDSWENADEIYEMFAYNRFQTCASTYTYKNNKLYNNETYHGYEDFVSTSEQYYVMADFVDYAIRRSLEYYVRPLQDSDIDWNSVRDLIGIKNYSSIMKDSTFSVTYQDINDYNPDKEWFTLDYTSTTGRASTPLEDAVSLVYQILALGEYENNTFRIMERKEGTTNVVRWKTEKAIDYGNANNVTDVYEMTRYSFNTEYQRVEVLDVVPVILRNGVYYQAYKIKDTVKLKTADGAYAYESASAENVQLTPVIIDRVPEHVLVNQAGDEVEDALGNPIVIPEFGIRYRYQTVNWPQKLYNDLSIIFADANFDNYINAGTWENSLGAIGEIGGGESSSSISTAMISPLGMIMSQLFLGNATVADEYSSYGTLEFGSTFSDDTIDAMVKSVGDQYDYITLKSQIEHYCQLYNYMMSPVLDDVANHENFNVVNADQTDTVTLEVYKAYLASVLLNDECMDYLSYLATEIISVNSLMYYFNEENETELISYQALSDSITGNVVKANKIVQMLTKFETNGYTDTEYYKALKSYKEGTNKYQIEAVSSRDFDLGLGEDDEEYIIYEYLDWHNEILNADLLTYGDGIALSEKQEDLEAERESQINTLKTTLIKSKAQNALKQIQDIDKQLFSLQKFYISQAFRTYISDIYAQDLKVTVNGREYFVNPHVSTSVLVEMIFGNQLVDCCNEFFSKPSELMFVDPGYEGAVKILAGNLDSNGQYRVYEASVQIGTQTYYYDNETSKIYNKDGAEVEGVTFTTPATPYSRFIIANGMRYDLNGDKVTIGGHEFTETADKIVVSTLVLDSSFDLLKNFLIDFGDSCFKLNNTNLVNLSETAINYVAGDLYYSSVATLLRNDLIRQYPGMARYMVNGSEGMFSYDDLDTLLNGDASKTVPNEATTDDTTDTILNPAYKFVFDYEITSYNGSKVDVKIYYSLDGEQFSVIKQNIDVPSIVSNLSNKALVENIYSYWGFDYDESGVDTEGGVYIPYGKSLQDYRIQAIEKVINLENRSGETEEQLRTRFLSMLAFATSDYSNITFDANHKPTGATISSDTYSKSVLKSLAGVGNRPDEDLIDLQYSADFASSRIDEANGTVFIMCTYNKATNKYIPVLTTNKSGVIDKNGIVNFFKSSIITDPDGGDSAVFYPTVAKGLIDNQGNPTAIRMVDGNIEYYRDEIYVANASRLGMSTYYQTAEDLSASGNPITLLTNSITKLITGKTLTQLIVEKIPRLSVESQLSFPYGSREEVFKTVEDGYTMLDYNFADIGIDAYFNVSDLNLIILVMGTIFLFIAIMSAMWGLIQRIFDIVLLFIVSPPIIATLAMDKNDNSGKFTVWRDKMVSAVLSVYGVVIGLNVFFLLTPIIAELELFTSADAFAEVSLFKNISVPFINNATRILFLLVAITMIKKAPIMFTKLISVNKDSQDIFSKGDATRKNVNAAFDSVKDHVSGQFAMDKVSKLTSGVKSFIPGRELMAEGKEKFSKMKNLAEAKAAEKAAIASGVPKKVAKQQAAALRSAADRVSSMKREKRNKKAGSLSSRESARSARG